MTRFRSRSTRIGLAVLLVAVTVFARLLANEQPRPPASPPAAADLTPGGEPSLATTATRLGVTLPAPPPWAERLLVQRVVDGDTFVARYPDGRQTRVRLVGVDTPETVKPNSPVECFGHDASQFTKHRLEGQTVLAARDVSEQDQYGRQLRLVWLQDGTLFNAELVASGYAQVSTYPPDVTHADLFLRLQRHAREQRLGLWQTCR